MRLRFGKDPLYRKEMLWFLRDRGAIVQVILIPLTVASFQLFNMRGLLVHASDAWNYLCGAGILFGTYFLLILGPKSLSSEGAALWISLTWPRGLESLLKAKAWLWSLISTGLVMLVSQPPVPVIDPAVSVTRPTMPSRLWVPASYFCEPLRKTSCSCATKSGQRTLFQP